MSPQHKTRNITRAAGGIECSERSMRRSMIPSVGRDTLRLHLRKAISKNKLDKTRRHQVVLHPRIRMTVYIAHRHITVCIDVIEALQQGCARGLEQFRNNHQFGVIDRIVDVKHSKSFFDNTSFQALVWIATAAVANKRLNIPVRIIR
jgi:hypothetical protein